jgi:hypothetical protein
VHRRRRREPRTCHPARRPARAWHTARRERRPAGRAQHRDRRGERHVRRVPRRRRHLGTRPARRGGAHERAPVAVCWQATLGEDAPPSGRILDGDVSGTILDGIIPHLGATTVERAHIEHFDTRYEASDDVEWWLRTAQRMPVATTPEVGLLYRVHGGPRPRTSQRKRLENGYLLLEEHASYFDAHPRAKAFRLMRMGLSATRIGERRTALRLLGASFRLDPKARTAWHALRAAVPVSGDRERVA